MIFFVSGQLKSFTLFYSSEEIEWGNTLISSFFFLNPFLFRINHKPNRTTKWYRRQLLMFTTKYLHYLDHCRHQYLEIQCWFASIKFVTYYTEVRQVCKPISGSIDRISSTITSWIQIPFFLGNYFSNEHSLRHTRALDVENLEFV